MGAEDRLANFGSTARNPLHISVTTRTILGQLRGIHSTSRGTPSNAHRTPFRKARVSLPPVSRTVPRAGPGESRSCRRFVGNLPVGVTTFFFRPSFRAGDGVAEIGGKNSNPAHSVAA